MPQLIPFVLNLAIITWLRTVVVARRRSSLIHRWCIELGFGALIALPLLGA